MTSKRHRHSHTHPHSHSHSDASSSPATPPTPTIDPTRLLPFLTAHFGAAEIVSRASSSGVKTESADLEDPPEEDGDEKILADSDIVSDAPASNPSETEYILVTMDEKEVLIDLSDMSTSCKEDRGLERKVHAVLGMAIATVTPLSVAYAAVASGKGLIAEGGEEEVREEGGLEAGLGEGDLEL